MVRSVKDEAEFGDVYATFEEKLTPENVKNWIGMATAFAQDTSAPDPYYRVSKGTSFIHCDAWNIMF